MGIRTLPKIGYELKPQDFKNIGEIIGQDSENEELSRNRAQAKENHGNISVKAENESSIIFYPK